jgi:hypothetical protein
VSVHHLGLQMHVVVALVLFYLAWQWVKTANDFSRGVVRFQIWWSHDAFAFRLADDPARFRISTAIKVLILTPLTILFSLLLLAP